VSIREWARTLGWPEGREEPALRLRIRKSRNAYRITVWSWWLRSGAEMIDCDSHPTFAEALAVGLAALEAATLRAHR
jgi:hypothetical protein